MAADLKHGPGRGSQRDPGLFWGGGLSLFSAIFTIIHKYLAVLARSLATLPSYKNTPSKGMDFAC